jgi:hypothetical protein
VILKDLQVLSIPKGKKGGRLRRLLFFIFRDVIFSPVPKHSLGR